MRTLVLFILALAATAMAGEQLYNGIELPDAWPPRLDKLPEEATTPPYLKEPPKVIPIDVGRQLFVDDFLIESTTLKRQFHQAEIHPGSPVLKPDRDWEKTGPFPSAMVFSDGVWWDPREKLFKMWYMAPYVGGTCYATSPDGIAWEKPALDVVPGTNIVLPGKRDSETMWMDLQAADPSRRFTIFRSHGSHMSIHASADGIHWRQIGGTGREGDRSTAFYNPFRQVWVISARAELKPEGRARRYFETRDLAQKPLWSNIDDPVLWTNADKLDPQRADLKVQPELYNLDATPYESLMLGLFSIWYGQPKDRAKPNQIVLGFSRDGFHWMRPSREPFIGVSEKAEAWNWANVQSAGGGCLVVGDKLYFYFSARSGRKGSSASGTCVTGLATLRRDGFASMEAGDEGGVLTTRTIQFKGKHLFVNANAGRGELTAEILDEAGEPIEGFARPACKVVRSDGTRQQISWEGKSDLGELSSKSVRVRFHMKNASLNSFWVSPDASGASLGYVAAGGPGLTGPTDTVGGEP